MMSDSQRVAIRLLGPFSVTGQDGLDVTPRGRKTCAMLAMLVVSPDHVRSRKWLQDKLWSDRGEQQGAASLRQSLVEVRRSFGPLRDVLQSDHFHVWLDQDRFTSDMDLQSSITVMGRERRDFLEGLDVRDPEFEEWLRQQRRICEEVAAAAVATTTQGRPSAGDKPALQTATRLFVDHSGHEEGSFSNQLVDLLCQSLVESGAATIADLKPTDEVSGDELAGRQSGLVFTVTQSEQEGQELAYAKLSSPANNRVLWSSSLEASAQPGGELRNEALAASANQIAAICIHETQSVSHGSSVEPEQVICARAINQLYKLGRDNFSLADQLFALAYEQRPKAIYLAWRAYARTFMLAERAFNCRETLIEEAESFIKQALEKEPYNSYVAGLAAQVYNIIFRSYVAAHEYAQRSIDLNQSNAIGWSQLGIAKCHLGQVKSGFDDTQYAVRISGSAPFKFQLAGISCSAATMAGNLDRAIGAAEISMALQPDFTPPLRYLSVLYLHRGELSKSQHVLQRLHEVEPDFSFDLMKDRAYPAAGLNHSGLLDTLPTQDVG